MVLLNIIKNNGYIQRNETASSGGVTNIKYNINNGNIEGIWDADVSDAIVNKTT